MNKTFRSFLLLLSSSFLLASCNGGSNPSSSAVSEASIALSQTALSLETYEEATLSYSLTGKEGTPSWKSSDASIATVDSQGKVTGVKAGSCTITVFLDDLSASCEVTVTSISQAPRIVLGEPSVALDKGGTYVIDAYAVYKNEIRDDSLDVSLKGSDMTIASATYANKKITISGLEYGQADFVVHANILGVLVTANLHVQIVNADIALKLGNMEMKDGNYSLNLAMYKVEDDGLPTEFAPEVIFTDKEQPASYELAYSSSNSNVAVWDDSHKILAKGVGDAILKIACDQFGLSLEIKVSVVKGAYTVILENINEAGESTTEKVGENKLPKTVPSIEGKTFVGWYDTDGNKVTSITEDVTLVARWTASYYDDNNAKVLTFRNVQSDYTTPDGVDAAYAVRSDAERENDVGGGTYPGTPEGSQGFNPGSNSNASLGLGLPAFDFSKVSGVRFTFGFHAGVWSGVSLNDNALGNDACGEPGYTEYKFKNFEVTITGKSVSVYNNYTKATITFELDDDTYAGRKGLEIKTGKSHGAWLFLTPFVTFDCDYLSLAASIEDALPEAPASGYADQIKRYSDLRSLMTEYEKAANPVSEKMQAWIGAATPKKVLEFADKGASVLEGLTGTGASAVSQGSRYSAQENCLDLCVGDNDATYTTLTLPAFDFSSYAKTAFSLGIGGGVDGSNRKAVLWLGGVTTPEGYSGSGWDNALSTSPNVCLGHTAKGEGTGEEGNFDTEFVSVTVAGGKITFSSPKSEFASKTYDLDADVNSGAKGLALTLGFFSWNDVVITPFYASKI